jgi:hypothetical protein
MRKGRLLTSPIFPVLHLLSVSLTFRRLFFFLINFLRNVSECEILPNQVVLWAMQLGFVQDDALSSPLSVRLMQLEDAAQICKNEPVRSPISFLIVRHVYEALFKPANLFRQFRSCKIDEILRQSPDSVMSYVAYAPIAGERANSTLDLDSLSFQHSLAVGFLGFFRPDPGFYSTFLSDKCDRNSEKRLLIGLLLAEASPECSTALGNFLKNVPPYFQKLVDNSLNRDALMTVYLARNDAESGRALVKYGPTIRTFLRPRKFLLHQIVEAIFADARGSLERVDIFGAIELFKRLGKDEKIEFHEFETILRLCHDRILSFAELDPLFRLFFLLGSTPGWNSPQVVPVETIEDLVFGVGFAPDARLLYCHIVLMAARLLPETPMLPDFFDFFQIYLSGVSFRKAFPSVSPELIRRNCGRLFPEAVRLSREKQLSLNQFNIPLNDLVFFCADYIVESQDYVLFETILPLLDSNTNPLAGNSALITDYLTKLLLRPQAEALPLLRRLHDIADWSSLVYTTLVGLAFTDPSKAAAFLHLLPRHSASTATLLSSLPPIKSIPGGFLIFLNEVLSRPRHLCYQPSQPRHSLSVFQPGWSEDPPEPETSSGIWDWPAQPNTCAPPTGKSDRRDIPSGPCWICFSCPTTRSSAICEGCAISCHRDHDLYYLGERQFSCTCSQQCRCKFFPIQSSDQTPSSRGSGLVSGRLAAGEGPEHLAPSWAAASTRPQPRTGSSRYLGRSGAVSSDSPSSANTVGAPRPSPFTTAPPNRGFGSPPPDSPEPSAEPRNFGPGRPMAPTTRHTGWSGRCSTGWGRRWGHSFGQSSTSESRGSSTQAKWGSGKPASKAEPEGPVPSGIVCRLIRSLALAELPPKEILTGRATRTPNELLSQPLSEVNDPQPCLFKSVAFKMTDVPHLVSPSSGGFGSPTRPFWTGGAVGPGKTILAVCFGDFLQTFNIETRGPLRSQILPFAVFQFSVADFDPAVVALSSLNRIGVLSTI